ncbi:MAG: HEAT repeat domain-containing protein [Ignavibacteriales bacterium]|nr:HEAT repeat domain-containing protein [Ignavibacteriales bacterium]
MKPRFIISSIAIAVLLITTSAFSQSNNNLDDELKLKIIQKSPLKGLKCTDEALRLNCAFALGKMKSEKAVIPLMKMLREDPCEAVRIVAAQALIEIGDPRGIYLVGRSAKFNDSERVRNVCSKFYSYHLFSESLAKLSDDSIEELTMDLEIKNQ